MIARAVLPLLIPGILLGQAAATHAAPPPPPTPVAYRGFAPGISYRELLGRAQALAEPGAIPLVCNTSRHTAQLIECGGHILDPTDSARFYLSAHVIGGRVDYLSFGDSGTGALVERRQLELQQRFGAPHRMKNGMWEWKGAASKQMVRFTWRGSGAARWIYVSLWDATVMRGIHPYIPSTPAKPTTSHPTSPAPARSP